MTINDKTLAWINKKTSNESASASWTEIDDFAWQDINRGLDDLVPNEEQFIKGFEIKSL